MHLPISECETFGSDSDGEARMRTKGQELLAFRHRARSGERTMRKKHLEEWFFSSCALSEIENGGGDSSSSSEASQGGRKPFYLRKAKVKGQNSLKRHIRSSSGYSSHTEETTFSFGSRPSVKLSDMHSRSHDLDVMDCEKRGKRRTNKGRLTAETSFQIDV